MHPVLEEISKEEFVGVGVVVDVPHVRGTSDGLMPVGAQSEILSGWCLVWKRLQRSVHVRTKHVEVARPASSKIWGMVSFGMSLIVTVGRF